MKNFSLFLVFGAIVLLFSCSKEEVQTSSPQTQSINNAKIWFENNPGQNNFSLLEFADKIDWQKAKSFDYADQIIVEVPIVLRQNIFLTADKSKVSTNRLLFIKTDDYEFISYIINISSSKNNLDFINDLTKINYYNIPANFTGNVLIIKNDNKSVNLNVLIDGKEKIKKDKSLSKEAEISCYEIVELFDDGSVRSTGIVYCVDGGGGSYGTNYTYYGGGGGGTGASSEATSPPSCESFNFVKTGSNWQESAVKNIRFVIVVYDPPLGAYINQIIEFSQPILFGSPINLLIGNTNISSGAAAETGAEVLRISMQETVNRYGNKTVDELTVRLYFESRLKDNYSLMVPGGRVNINATNYSVTPTEYKSTWFGTANCN